MALFEWTESLSVQIASIDTQHKKIIELINLLHSAMEDGKTQEVNTQTLDELSNYTQYHFKYEEEMMRRAGYKDIVAHKAVHNALILQLKEIDQKSKSGSAMVTAELLDFLKYWLTTHIAETDKKYSLHMRAKGLQ